MTAQIHSYIDTIAAHLERYFAVFPEDRQRLDVLIRQVEERSDALCYCSGLPGHLTASALVYSAEKQSFLLIHHNFLKRWLQPGGHMEPMEDPIAGAERELSEEVGALPVILHPWQQEYGVPIDIDSHKIPASPKKNEPEHLHHDFQYLFLLQAENDISLQEDEVSAFRWAPLEELLRGDCGRRLARTVEKMQQLKLLP